jgi:hypothetical protein
VLSATSELVIFLVASQWDKPGNQAIPLGGNVARLVDGKLSLSVEAALRDIRPLDYADFPICAVIAPTDQSDHEHALGDSSSWAHITIQSLLSRELKGLATRRLDSDCWMRVRTLISELPARLTRHVPGGHFFFLGREGARSTAMHIHELILEAEALVADLQEAALLHQ